jgi:hypothetical protein
VTKSIGQDRIYMGGFQLNISYTYNFILNKLA